VSRRALEMVRFDAVQRAVHWVNAAMFAVLIATAIPLYFGSFFGVVVARHPVQLVHLFTGLALPVPLLAAMAGPWGERTRADLRRFALWTRSEARWLRTFGRESVEAGKFNPGQKANAAFTGAAAVVLLATGFILQWFRFFPVPWREGATFTHDLFAFVVVAVIVGHVWMALAHPASLRAMLTGRVSRDWARRHAPDWAREVDRAEREPEAVGAD
jgi:formate dehydrogenase subunit gamma